MAAHPLARLLPQSFPINAHTGEALSEEAVTEAHYAKIQQLQRLFFKHWQDSPQVGPAQGCPCWQPQASPGPAWPPRLCCTHPAVRVPLTWCPLPHPSRLQLQELALATCAHCEKRTNLAAALAPLSLGELQRLAITQLRLVGEGDADAQVQQHPGARRLLSVVWPWGSKLGTQLA
jgi:hypothetical protein